jgi:molybdopterin-guanine dinucleotide biosynthesis protein
VKASTRANEVASSAIDAALWRVIVIGGHTRSIGKTQLVCDVIRAFPKANWVAGKITQYGHGVCAQNGQDCDCAPDEHVSAFNWETHAQSGTDSARFLAAGAQRSFWLRTKQGFLAEGLPLMRSALRTIASGDSRPDVEQNETVNVDEIPAAVIVESNSLLQFMRPSLYLAVIDPSRDDFKDTARAALDRADALILRGSMNPTSPEPAWLKLPAALLRLKPSVTQREGEPLPEPLHVLVERVLQAPPSVAL